MVKEGKSTWKANYFVKITQLFNEYNKCFVVGVDNVGSKQMQQIRGALREHAVILMGKNTMMRKAMRALMEQNQSLEKLMPHIVGNIGFVFTNGDLSFVRNIISENKVAAPAKAGALAPLDVTVDARNTGMGPEKTSFFQALSIPTKIAKGTIEILSDVQLIRKGEKVGASEATLLGMLKIFPFSYGLTLEQVYDSGSVYSPEILDITDEDLRNQFMQATSKLAAVCLAIDYPTTASVPHSIVNGFKNLLSIAAVTDITFKEAEMMKEYLADPSKFAVAAAPVADTGAKEEAKKVVEEESDGSDDDMGFGLFD